MVIILKKKVDFFWLTNNHNQNTPHEFLKKKTYYNLQFV